MSADTTAPLPAWEQSLEKNFKKIVLLFALVTAGLLVYGISRYLGHAADVKAGEAFASAKTVEDLDVVLSQHKGSRAAGNALLQKAELLWEQNKKTTSVDTLKAFVADYASHPLLPQALLALGTKLESLGQRDEAKKAFERVTNEFSKSELSPLAELRLGDLAWAEGKEEEAKKIYEGLPARFTGMDAGNPFIAKSEDRLQWISARLPTKEVDGPPKPKVEEKKDAAPAPGAPVIKLNSAGGSALAPTLAPEGAGATPMPAAAPAPVIPTPAPANPKPVTIPVPAPDAPPAPVPASPAPAATPPAAPAPAAATPPPPAAPAKPEEKPAEAAPKAP